mgnify:CR=1 FL=1
MRIWNVGYLVAWLFVPITILLIFSLEGVALQIQVSKDYVVLGSGGDVPRNQDKRSFKFIIQDLPIENNFADWTEEWDCNNCKPSIKEASVSGMWNVVMGEAIEDYKFYWKGSGTHQAEGEFSTSNLYNRLAKYPDLLKRYKDVKPRFKIRFNVAVEDIEYGMNDPNFTKEVSSDLFMVGRSGEFADLSVPSSPTWEKFFTNIGGHWEEGVMVENVNAYKKIFSKAQKISVNASIFDIEWPQSVIEGIVKEYERREGIETEQKEEEERQENTDETEDDFWAGDEDEKEGESAENDGFWEGKSNTDSEPDKKEESEGFWEGEAASSGSDDLSNVFSWVIYQNQMKEKRVEIKESDYVPNDSRERNNWEHMKLLHFELIEEHLPEVKSDTKKYLRIIDYKECGFYFASQSWWARWGGDIYFADGKKEYGEVSKGEFISYSGEKFFNWNMEGKYSEVRHRDEDQRSNSKPFCFQSPNGKQHIIIPSFDDRSLQTRPEMEVYEGFYLFDFKGNSPTNGYIKFYYVSPDKNFFTQYKRSTHTLYSDIPNRSEIDAYKELFEYAKSKEEYDNYGIFIGLKNYQTDSEYQSWQYGHEVYNLEFDILSAEDYSVIDIYRINSKVRWFLKEWDRINTHLNDDLDGYTDLAK